MNESAISILTHGCRANQYESDAMRHRLTQRASVMAPDMRIHILNGCTVTNLADRKARQAARRIRREDPNAFIILIGCTADAVIQGLARFDEADLIAGGGWKPHIEDVVAAALAGRRGVMPAPPEGNLAAECSEGPEDRIRAFLKVQDGCSLQCSYCRPTQVRGPSRSKPLSAVLVEAERLIALGFPEIVLTGINLAQYTSGRDRLADLAREILRNRGLRRLRLASINPSGLTDDLLEIFSDDARACRHFHVPLQSGDNAILEAMGRTYTAAEYVDALARVRERLPNATFGADLMVGFPGETREAFERTVALAEQIRFANTHVFRFSPRPGTTAADLPGRIPAQEKRSRAERLDEICRSIRREHLDNRMGTTQDVLVEACRNERWCGYTRDYFYVSFDSGSAIPLGVERAVQITDVDEDHLRGEDVERSGPC